MSHVLNRVALLLAIPVVLSAQFGRLPKPIQLPGLNAPAPPPKTTAPPAAGSKTPKPDTTPTAPATPAAGTRVLTAPPPPPPKPIDYKLNIPFEQFALPNGLRVILSRDNAVPVVSMMLAYQVGSQHEEKGRIGYAHLIERMMAESAASVDAGEYPSYVTLNGGRIAEATHPGYTEFAVTATSNQLASLLWLEAGRMKHLVITPETLKKAQDSIVETRPRIFEQQGYNAAFLEGWPSLVFDDPRNARAVFGPSDDVKAATVADVTAFYRTYYSPGNAILVIAGDFQAADAKKLIEQNFGDIPAQPPVPKPETSEPVRLRGRSRVAQDSRIAAGALVIGWTAPERHTPQWYALQMMDAILADGPASRLQLDLVEGRRSLLRYQSGIGWPYDVTAVSRQPAEYGIFVLARPGLRPQLIPDELQQEIDRFSLEGVGDTELRRVKAALRLHKLTALQSSSERAALLAQYALADGDPALIDKDFVALMGVTAQDIQSLAKRLLTLTRRDLLFVNPAPPPAPPRPPAVRK